MMMLKSGRILRSSSLDDVRPGLVDDREFHRVDSRIGSDYHDNQLAPSLLELQMTVVSVGTMLR